MAGQRTTDQIAAATKAQTVVELQALYAVKPLTVSDAFKAHIKPKAEEDTP